MSFELTSVQLDENLLFNSWIRQTYLIVVVMFQCIRTMWVWTARRFRSSCLWCWQTQTTNVCRSTAPSCGAKPWVPHHITFLIYLTLLVLVDVKLFTFYFSQSFYFVVLTVFQFTFLQRSCKRNLFLIRIEVCNSALSGGLIKLARQNSLQAVLYCYLFKVEVNTKWSWPEPSRSS